MSGLEERPVAVDRNPAEPVRQRTERDDHDGGEARGNEQAHGSDELVAGEDPVLCRQEGDQQGGVDGGVAVLAHPQANTDQGVLLGVLPQLADGVLGHVLVLLKFLEDGRFLQPQPDEDGNRNQEHAGQERHPPQPALQRGLVRHGNQRKGPGAEQGAQLDADERERSEEAPTAARCDFGNQRGGPGLLRAGAQALNDAQGHQENGTHHSRLFKGRQQTDGEAGRTHQADREDKDHLAAEPVADVAEEHSAEGPGRETDAVRGKRGDQGAVFAERLEEQRAEDQGRSQAVDVEVVVLQSRAHGAGKSRPSQLIRIDDIAVRFSKRCIGTSCHKHSLKNTPDPRWPGGI